jgi:hypothetical protein
MLLNLLFGLSTMTVCLLLQSLILIWAIHYYSRHEYQLSNASILSSLTLINSVMLLLLIGNLAQIAIWALLFQSLSEFQQFREAFYHSAVNFATLGYGDLVMSDKHKLLGPLQAINGVLMIGLSTAALMAFFEDAIKKTLKARQG